MVDIRMDEMVKALQSRGFRLTPQRLAIVKILAEEKQHASAEQIFSRVRQVFPTISLATVYKTVEALKNSGQIHELNVIDGRTYFDATHAYPHPHLVCTRCKTVVDVEMEALDGIPARVAALHGFINVKPRIEFYGICSRCQSEMTKADD